MSKKKELEKKKKVAELKARAERVKSGMEAARNISAANKTRDARTEQQQVERYKGAPESNSPLNIKDGITSKGVFTSLSKEKEDKEKKRRAKGFR